MNPATNADFIAADGDVEFTTDGTCVNMTEGWHEMRVGIFANMNAAKAFIPINETRENCRNRTLRWCLRALRIRRNFANIGTAG